MKNDFITFRTDNGEVDVRKASIATVANAAGGKHSIVHLIDGRKLIVEGGKADVMCKVQGIRSWRDCL